MNAGLSYLYSSVGTSTPPCMLLAFSTLISLPSPRAFGAFQWFLNSMTPLSASALPSPSLMMNFSPEYSHSYTSSLCEMILHFDLPFLLKTSVFLLFSFTHHRKFVPFFPALPPIWLTTKHHLHTVAMVTSILFINSWLSHQNHPYLALLTHDPINKKRNC